MCDCVCFVCDTGKRNATVSFVDRFALIAKNEQMFLRLLSAALFSHFVIRLLIYAIGSLIATSSHRHDEEQQKKKIESKRQL